MQININGQTVNYDGDTSMPILWFLRDIQGLTGTKFGCGKALCGACTVHLDGNAIRSCVTPVAAAKNKQITTIEGLHPQHEHPIQKAWREHDVPQCGYCQSGQMMQAAALLDNNPQADDDLIASTMAGNLCRCGTYPRIRAAIASAAEEMSS